MTGKTDSVLNVEHFSLLFPARGKNAFAVNDISFSIGEGEIAGLVGESGCGKTMTALSCIGLQPESAVLSGSIRIAGKNALSFSEDDWTRERGKTVSMIFQEPMTSLNPLEKVGQQIAETGILHGLSKRDAKDKALFLMEELNLPDVNALYSAYPHQLSGGQRQRIMIASALMNEPKLLIADEPTTALDAATQAQIIKLLQKMNAAFKTSVLFVSHDLLLVKKLCAKVYIMYAGRILECGDTRAVLENPMHPYTRALVNALPSYEKKAQELDCIAGFVPTLEHREEDGVYLYERWADSKDECYIPKAKKDGGVFHQAYCHVHNVLEDV